MLQHDVEATDVRWAEDEIGGEVQGPFGVCWRYRLDSCAEDGGEIVLVFGIEPSQFQPNKGETSSLPSDAHSARSCLSDLFTVANSLLCYPFHDVFPLLSLPFS